MVDNNMSSTIAEEIMTPNVVMLDHKASLKDGLDNLMLNKISALLNKLLNKLNTFYLFFFAFFLAILFFCDCSRTNCAF